MTDEDPQLAVYMMLESLDPLRQIVARQWEKCHAEGTCFMIASSVMNTAVSFAQRIESDFLGAFPQFNDWEDVTNKVLPFLRRKRDVTGPNEASSRRVQDETFFLPFEQLRHFQRSLKTPKRHSTPSTVDRFPRPSDSQRSSDEACQDDKIMLNELFGEILLLAIQKKDLLTEDELVQGLKVVFDGGKVTLWMAFGLQLWLDKQNVLGKLPKFVHPITTSNAFCR